MPGPPARRILEASTSSRRAASRRRQVEEVRAMATTVAPDTAMAQAARGYAHPEVLVSTEWVAQHLDDPSVRIVESDEDILLYDIGHVPGAIKLDWHTDLQNPV